MMKTMRFQRIKTVFKCNDCGKEIIDYENPYFSIAKEMNTHVCLAEEVEEKKNPTNKEVLKSINDYLDNISDEDLKKHIEKRKKERIDDKKDWEEWINHVLGDEVEEKKEILCKTCYPTNLGSLQRNYCDTHVPATDCCHYKKKEQKSSLEELKFAVDKLPFIALGLNAVFHGILNEIEKIRR